ncbi:TPR-like protein [Wilcoxina mikolae CBS 423.85]|nr:TPR-like protein [Wilcoxina mikolae CBS 423.85]
MKWFDGTGLNLAIEDLADVSLIRPSSHSGGWHGSFSINPLVHRWAREHINEEEQRENASDALSLVAAAIVTEPSKRNQEYWNFELRIMNHIQHVTKYYDGLDLLDPKASMSFRILGMVNFYWAHYERCTNLYRRALPGLQYRDALQAMNELGRSLVYQGQYDEGQGWIEKALAEQEMTLGKDHPLTLDTVHNMAVLFDNQGAYDKALECYWRALSGYEEAFGNDHPSVHTTVNNIAAILDIQGKHDEALVLCQRALDDRENTLGKNHPSTLTTVHNMAVVFGNRGEFDKALEWCQRALQGYKRTFRSNHLSTLTAIHNMATIFDNQGEYDKALEWYQLSLDGCERILGENHPLILDTVHNMATVFDIQGEYERALVSYQRALDGRASTLGKDHPLTLTTVHNMASVFVNKGEYDKALEWYQRALDGCEKNLGRNHPSTLHTADCIRETERIRDVLAWHRLTLGGCKNKSLGNTSNRCLCHLQLRIEGRPI